MLHNKRQREVIFLISTRNSLWWYLHFKTSVLVWQQTSAHRQLDIVSRYVRFSATFVGRSDALK